jgi:hypothetical protein
VGDLNSLSIVVQDLSLTYDITAVAILPSYGDVPMPRNRLGPRRWSLLYSADRLQIKRLSLASPLELVFAVATGLGAGPRIIKPWLDVLATGQDIRARQQVFEENRELRPEHVRAARLDNELKEQQLRIITARAELVERALQGDPGEPPNEQDHEHETARGTRSYPADSLTSGDYARLLEDPIERILGYGGGELEIAYDESSENG